MPYVSSFQNFVLTLLFITFFCLWDEDCLPLPLFLFVIPFLLLVVFVCFLFSAFLCILSVNLDFKFPIFRFIRIDNFFFFSLIPWLPLSSQLKHVYHAQKIYRQTSLWFNEGITSHNQASWNIYILLKISPSWVGTRKINRHYFLIKSKRINLHQGNVEA